MKMSLELMPHITIAYIRTTGPYGVENVQTMERLKAWASHKDLLNEHSIILVIAQDDPSVILAQDCRYDTSIVVPDEYKVNDEYVFPVC